MSVLVTVLMILVIALLAWAAFNIEPHWCSKDGRRMICRAQLLDDRSMPVGTWHEVRVIAFEKTVDITSRGIRARPLHGEYRVTGRSSTPPKRKEIFVLQGVSQVVLKLPNTSRAIETLESLRSDRQ